MGKKGLDLNAEKLKIIRCKMGGGRKKEACWRWKGKVIEEVKEYKYLGYVIQRNEKQGERQGKEGSSGVRADLGNRKKKIPKGLEQKSMVI